ncbi:hypothetical protein Terro_2965 [Terriglobus roseus DSM 18391]|uniref:Uncharacterized protein n=1 Tax=Terriglobus roseus (strain DSM 18391 / NRRL B-41598 / KBS 63) TaxID=926566 RepID=I3ZIX9_TERRK|nr:hypothetical protein Terro_2965 [Terriglobus roseus DSM 18391]
MRAAVVNEVRYKWDECLAGQMSLSDCCCTAVSHSKSERLRYLAISATSRLAENPGSAISETRVN